MKPWITKKIIEYLGEEEITLIEFILAKMSQHMAPQEILDQLAFVLEDEAEMFVIKLWRYFYFVLHGPASSPIAWLMPTLRNRMLIFEMIRAQKAKERNAAFS